MNIAFCKTRFPIKLAKSEHQRWGVMCKSFHEECNKFDGIATGVLPGKAGVAIMCACHM